jgi:hypothetical protein
MRDGATFKRSSGGKQLAGTMMIAKAMTDRDVSDHFLEQARAFYAAAFETGAQRNATKS